MQREASSHVAAVHLWPASLFIRAASYCAQSVFSDLSCRKSRMAAVHTALPKMWLRLISIFYWI